eukprot:UN09595
MLPAITIPRALFLIFSIIPPTTITTFNDNMHNNNNNNLYIAFMFILSLLHIFIATTLYYHVVIKNFYYNTDLIALFQQMQPTTSVQGNETNATQLVPPQPSPKLHRLDLYSFKNNVTPICIVLFFYVIPCWTILALLNPKIAISHLVHTLFNI